MEAHSHELPFATDDQIIAAIKRAEDALTHLEYAAGVVRRDLASMRQQLEPRVQPAA